MMKLTTKLLTTKLKDLFLLVLLSLCLVSINDDILASTLTSNNDALTSNNTSNTNYISNNRLANQREIAILQMVEHPAINATRQGILDELKNDNVTIISQSAQGNIHLVTQIAKKYVGNRSDILVGIGTTASQALMSANYTTNIPIVFSSVTNPKTAKLVKNLEHPEGMVTGVSNYVDPDIQFKFFKTVLPKLKRLGVIYNPGESNSVALLQNMKEAANANQIELIAAPANHSAEVTLSAHYLLPQVDAIFINNDNTALSAFDSIVRISRTQGIPVFCSDSDMIKHGALATMGAHQYEIGRQTGKMIRQLLEGKLPSELPVSFAEKTMSLVNNHE